MKKPWKPSTASSGPARCAALGASAMYGYQFYNMQLAARTQRLDAVRFHAEPLQPALPRGRARADPRLRTDARFAHALLPAGRAAGSPAPAGTRTPCAAAPTKPPPKPTTARASQDTHIVLRVHSLAEKYGATMAQIALAWHYAKGVAAPVIGATQGAEHLEEAAGALANHASRPRTSPILEEPYVPHKISGAEPAPEK